MVNTRVFSCFPGTGKSWVYEHRAKFYLNILDSDSSTFSWISPGVRNPEFPNNYMKHIKGNIGYADIILVSSHEVVRKALKENDLRYDIVYPHICSKELYMERYLDRGNDEEFIKLLWLNWNTWIQSIQIDEYPIQHVLPGDLYLSDLLLRL